MEETNFIWFNGEMVPWHECKVHFLTHSLHYGSAIFEGIRCYETSKGPAIFCLQEHIKRLFYSAEVFGMKIPFTEKQLCDAVTETVKLNKIKACYIRPLVFYGYGKMGLDTVGAGIDVGIAIWPWGAYLGEEGLEKGVKVKISPFVRPSRDTMPTNAKVSGNYANSIMAKMDALNTGYKDAILLDKNGFVAECSAENIFFIKKGKLVFPTLENSLDGITRKSVIEIAKDFGIEMEERNILEKEIFEMDEAFMTGTAAELTPISFVGEKPVGEGKPGAITKKIQEKFYEIVRGKNKAHEAWLTFVK